MISVSCSWKAPQGKFRVIGIDLFGRTGWKQGDYSALAEAISYAIEYYQPGNTDMHVHNDAGRRVFDAGECVENLAALIFNLKFLVSEGLLTAQEALDLL